MARVTILLAVLAVLVQTVVFASSPNIPPGSNARLPLDLYLLADHSGSIRAKWPRVVGFARNLTTRMASLAGGYYNGSLEDGLRVSITIFGCSGNTGNFPRADTIVSGPSGDEATITAGIDRMSGMRPNGGTCPSLGLNQFRQEIVRNRANAILPRPTAIIVLTDGDISRDDVAKTGRASSQISALEETYMFGLNYGGGREAANEWTRLIGDPSRIYEATDQNLDRIATLLSVIMLGRLSVNVDPTPIQLARVANFTTQRNGTTVCLGEDKVPFLLGGGSLAFFTAGELLCTFKRVENGQTLVIQPVERQSRVYCEVPGSLLRSAAGPNRFIQSFSLQLDVVSGNTKTTIFTVPSLSYNVAVCLNIVFQGSKPTGGPEDSNCFPPPDPTNSSVGALTLSGPTAQVAGSVFYCRFDNNARALAQVVPNGFSCRAPGVDVALALQQGTDPTPFRRFVVEVQDGTALLDSNVDSTDFTPVSCLATTPASKASASYCWNSTDASQVRAVFEGTSLSNLIRGFTNLEFTCLYQLAQRQVVVPGSLSGQQVTCAVPAELRSFFSDVYSFNATQRLVSVSLRTRSSVGSTARGWWVLGSDVGFTVRVSPCVDINLPSSVCMGQALSIGFGNVGLDNFLRNARPSCRFLDESNRVVATTPLSGTTCQWSQAIPKAKRVEVFDSSRVYLQSIFSATTIVPCFEYSKSFASSTFCWGRSLSQEQFVVEGASVNVYDFPRTRPTCRFDVDDRASSVFRAPATQTATRDGFVCTLPNALGFRSAPASWNVTFTVEDTTNGVAFADPAGPVRISIQSCVRPTPRRPDPRDLGKALPACAPNCCLQSELKVRFDGSAAEDIVLCDWQSTNGSVLATTTVREANASSSACVLGDWRPLVANSALPVARIVAYADQSRTLVLADEDMDQRRPCVWSSLPSNTVTLGGALNIAFNGPTVRSLGDGQFTTKCALMVPSTNGTLQVARVITARSDSLGGTSCVIDGMYDSLQGASIAVWTLPFESEAPTKRPTSAPGTSVSGNNRRLRSSSIEDARQLQAVNNPFAGGVLLFSQSLDNVQVSANMNGALAPAQCFSATSPSLELRFAGPGAVELKDAVTCEFTLRNGNSQSVSRTPAVLDASSNQLVCAWASSSSNGTSSVDLSAVIDYNATVARRDTGALIEFFSGSQPACALAGPPTSAPTVSGGGSAAAVGPGGIAGIVIGLIALLAILVFAIVYDQKRKNDRRKKREAEAAAAARKRAEQDRQNNNNNPADKDKDATTVNAAEVPPELISPVLSKNSSDVSRSSMLPRHEGLDDDDDLVVVPLAPAEQAKRRYRVGDCVQVLDPVDSTWRYTYVRNYASEPLEYILEDERQPVSESRMRWPNYAAGEAVEVRRRKNKAPGEDDGPAQEEEEWVPAVVAFADQERGTVGLMGASEEVPMGDVRPAPFRIGENVEERGPDGEWRPAVVVGVSLDGMYTVDGPGGLGLNRTRKRLRWPQYHGGDLVEVRDPDEENWRRATVVTMEGGVVVGLEDGSVDPKRFPNCDVRRPQLKSAPSVPNPEQSSVLSEGGGGESPRRKFKRREPLDFQELPDFCFEITIDKHHGMGVRFGWTKDQLVVVQKFLGLPGLDAGPLEASMRVSLGDQLLAINGVSIGGRSFSDVTEMIRSAPDVITLKFGRWKETVKMRAAIASGRKSENAANVDVSLV